jgi:transposase-like protein
MAHSVFDAPHFHDEEAALEFVEAHLWPDGPVCPFCGATAEKVGQLNGKRTRAGLRKCYVCRKQFTVKIGTVFEDSHCAMRHWLQAIHLLCSSKKGISTRQLQRTLGCGMKTAWFLGHRIREMMKRPDDLFQPPIGGAGRILEADETFVGRKPGVDPSHRAGSMNAVFALVERDGEARSFHVPDVRATTLRQVIAVQASRASDLMTDEARAYTGIGWNFASHGTVNHSADEYVRYEDDRIVSTNTVEGFFSILKRGVYGTYQHISEAHLKRYLAEFDFRYSNRERLGCDDELRASRALKGAKGKRLTYQTTR